MTAALATKICPWLRPFLTTLENAFTQGRLGHGWVIAGPRGTGKLNLAHVLADRLLRGRAGAEPPPDIAPDEIVSALDARRDPQDRHPDLHIVAPEEGKRSIGVDGIRVVIDQIALTGYSGVLKVVIIEPAEAMTTAAANALLKSLEEPAEGTHLLLVSHLPGRLPATIRSRCQTLVIARPEADAIARWLGHANAAPDNPLIVGPTVGPLQAAQRLIGGEINKYNKLADIIRSLSQGRSGAGDAVEACRTLDPDLVLEWIASALQQEVRDRMRAGVSNSITDARGDFTENPWRSMNASRLLGLLAESEKLRLQLDSGLNEQLALEVLLNEVVPA